MMFTIRKAVSSDTFEIVGLWKEMMAFHMMRDPYFAIVDNAADKFEVFISESIKMETSVVLAAESNGKLVGYTHARIAKYPPVFVKTSCCEILDMAVSSSYRRCGVGSALLKGIYARCDDLGIDRLECNVAVANEVSTKFWKNMGFMPAMKRLFIDR